MQHGWHPKWLLRCDRLVFTWFRIFWFRWMISEAATATGEARQLQQLFLATVTFRSKQEDAILTSVTKNVISKTYFSWIEFMFVLF